VPGAAEEAPGRPAPRPPEAAPADDAGPAREEAAPCDLVFALPREQDRGPLTQAAAHREALSALLAAAFVAAGAALSMAEAPFGSGRQGDGRDRRADRSEQ
jgi:hypothetical protein